MYSVGRYRMGEPVRYFLQKTSKLVKTGSFFDFPSGNISEETFSGQHKCRKH